MYRMPEKQIKMKWNAFELRSKRFSSVCKLPIVSMKLKYSGFFTTFRIASSHFIARKEYEQIAFSFCVFVYYKQQVSIFQCSFPPIWCWCFRIVNHNGFLNTTGPLMAGTLHSTSDRS